MNNNKLIKSSFIYTIGNMLVQGLAFLTLPIYVRMMSQTSYGEYSLYISWVTILSIIVGLQTNGSLSIAKIKYKEDYTKYSAHAFSVSTLTFLLIFILVILGMPIVVQLTGFSNRIVLLLLFQSYFTYVVSFLGQYFIQFQRAIGSLLLSLFTAITSIVLSVIFLTSIDDDFLARIMGMFIPYSLGTIAAYFYIYKKGKVFFRKSYLAFSLTTSIPLIFHALGNQVLNQLDRLMISRFLTTKDVALYSFGYSVGLILQVVLMSLNTAWVPWFFESRKKEKDSVELEIAIAKYLRVALFLTLGFSTIFPEIISIMGGQEYQSSKYFVSLIIISYFLVFLYTFPVNIQFFYENTKSIPIGTLIAALVNYLMNYILIPTLGIAGAAIATVCSYALLLVLHHSISYIRYKYKDVELKTYAILTSIVVFYNFIMNKFIDSMMIRYCIFSVIIIVFITLFYQETKNIYRDIIKK